MTTQEYQELKQSLNYLKNYIVERFDEYTESLNNVFGIKMDEKYCYCRKCEAQILCEHGKNEPHALEVCGNC